MAILYKCRHCKQLLGTINQDVIDAKLLGFQALSSEDRKEMIQYVENGDIEIKVICEDCQDTLEHNPHYHALDSFIQ
ncbi:anti-sigma-F factor Fin family protein [Paraliobacillus salinarum]|uniref:anti-sigma-F factor Fin family protein n=1 Tax=Paraliobacillus salinarum TaxID=1158996 RepID=UPI0015F5FF04|nr:anti-sigma-F factor Fin family protein [Paraliobacillus salinarum]